MDLVKWIHTNSIMIFVRGFDDIECCLPWTYYIEFAPTALLFLYTDSMTYNFALAMDLWYRISTTTLWFLYVASIPWNFAIAMDLLLWSHIHSILMFTRGFNNVWFCICHGFRIANSHQQHYVFYTWLKWRVTLHVPWTYYTKFPPPALYLLYMASMTCSFTFAIDLL